MAVTAMATPQPRPQSRPQAMQTGPLLGHPPMHLSPRTLHGPQTPGRHMSPALLGLRTLRGLPTSALTPLPHPGQLATVVTPALVVHLEVHGAHTRRRVLGPMALGRSGGAVVRALAAHGADGLADHGAQTHPGQVGRRAQNRRLPQVL